MLLFLRTKSKEFAVGSSPVLFCFFALDDGVHSVEG